MKAVVMAGGAGSRLRPLTISRPKPMVPIVNKPVMAHILDLLKRHNITDVIVTLQYMADVIQDHFGDGHNLGMNIQYSIEETPLGTAGSVKNAQQFLDDTFLVISGDALTDFDLTEIVRQHKTRGAAATLTLYRVPNPLEYGVIVLDGDGRVQQFLEKPSWGEVISDTVNTGIYVLEPKVLDYIEPGVPFDFSKDLFPFMLQHGDPLYGYVASGYWCDIGDLQEYMRATADMLEGRVHLEPLGHQIGGGIWCEDEVEIAPDAQLYGPIYLGYAVKLKGGVVIHGPTAIRNYSVVDNRAHVDRSIVWRNSYIGEGVELRGAIIGRQCSLKSKTVVFEGAVIGDGSVIGQGAVIHPNVKIWPEKEVEAGATVKTSIIWGSQGRKALFGRFGVTGQVNVDMTPEFATKLGAAFGATLPRGSKVTINRDPHRSSRMIKRAIIAGLPSAGVNVLDLRNVPIPVARYYTRVTDATGGVHVRLSPHDNRVVDIRFIDGRGLTLSKSTERDIERVFFREDFRRVYLDEIGTIEYAPGVIERYTEDFLAALNVEAIRAARLPIVVDYANSPTALVLPPILSELQCQVVALNASVDESRMSIPPDEFNHSLQQLALISQAVQSKLAARLDVGGEKLFLIDDCGRIVPPISALAAIATLALRANGGGTIAVPVNMPTIFEQIATQHGGSVERTKVDLQDLMAVASKGKVIMAGDGSGNIIFPRFHPGADGLFALAKLLEFLVTQNVSFSQVVDSLPPYYVAERRVSCPWEYKGTVMRLLNEQYKPKRGAQIDGTRIDLGKDWVLVLPDPDEPYVRVIAQSESGPQAQDLADKYARVVEGLQH
ncbi:MAG: mannose-1-phosphate guanyltransferase [Anaerolineae bacterium]|nr:mannose-1-phosphate guanyltransferase [Anaerolineae bacterium]